MKMLKRITIGLLCCALFFSATACLTVNKDLPPGQEKNITGEKDASSLAPGHNK